MANQGAQETQSATDISRGVGQLGQGRSVRGRENGGSNPPTPTNPAQEQIYTWLIMLLLHMADGRIIVISEAAHLLGIDWAAAHGLLCSMTTRGWLAYRYKLPYGWQITATGWLLAEAE